MPSDKNKTSRRRRISPSEREARRQRHEQRLASVEQMLFSRAQTAKALGDISIATVIRMENRKLLDKVRIAGTPKGKGAVYHRSEQVRALTTKV